jgi:hypothetical protein
MKPKNTICLWFDKDAHEAAQFYAATRPPAFRHTEAFPSRSRRTARKRRTVGAFPGRSPRARSPMRLRPVAVRPSAASRL